MNRSVYFLWSLLLIIFPIGKAGNILVIPGMISPSHKMGMVPLADALAQRGHDVLFWSPVVAEDKYIPKKAAWSQPKGIIDSQWRNELFLYQNDSSTFSMPWKLTFSIPGLESIMFYVVTPYCQDMLERHKTEFTNLLNKKWDLIIIDELFSPCGYLLTELVKAPVIVYVSTSCMTRHAAYRSSLPSPKSYLPTCAILDGYTDRMSFLQRTHNALLWLVGYAIDYVSFKLSTALLSPIYPQVTNLVHAVIKPDMTFSYFPYQVDYPQPTLPNIVNIPGLHISHDLKSLPDDISKAIQTGPEGFIVVSTGHWAKFEYADPSTKVAFINAFNRVAEHGLTILWQYSGDASLGGLAKGVFRFNWLPQKELLAHPKCKGIISHCGCNGVLEALKRGIPIVGLGLVAEQVNSAALLASRGISIRLDKTKLSEDVIYDAVIQVATNESLRSRARLYADILNNDKLQVMDKAVYWSEYVMRHKGAKWLKTRLPTGLLSMFYYYSIDVLIVLTALLCLFLVIAFYILRIIWRMMNVRK